MENATFTLAHTDSEFKAVFTPKLNAKGERVVQFQCCDGHGAWGASEGTTLSVEQARRIWTTLRKAGCVDLRKWVFINGQAYRREKHGAVSMTVTVDYRSSGSFSRYAPHGYVYMAHEYEERDEGLSADEDSVRIWFRPAAAPRALFAHDCDHCKFLGGESYNGVPHDLYVCEATGVREYIARYGANAEDYSAVSEAIARQFAKEDARWGTALELHKARK